MGFFSVSCRGYPHLWYTLCSYLKYNLSILEYLKSMNFKKIIFFSFRFENFCFHIFILLCSTWYKHSTLDQILIVDFLKCKKCATALTLSLCLWSGNYFDQVYELPWNDRRMWETQILKTYISSLYIFITPHVIMAYLVILYLLNKD